MDDPIFVTRPYLPPMNDFLPYLQQIWDTHHLTNAGPFHEKFEQELLNYLEVPQISVCCNGTIALVLALKALSVQGEVITTPYSFVATSHALLWNSITPVFVDVEPGGFNIDPAKIEAAITDKTTAILAVHCYGIPCDVEAIRKIADKHQLKVIYDAAHAFDVKDSGGSILRYGDLSIVSFHATKVFNTFEGGAIISTNPDVKTHIDQLKNFGITDQGIVVEAGINGKMSEFNASLGLVQLQYVTEAIAQRRDIDTLYRKLLGGLPGIKLSPLIVGVESNYGYFPIQVDADYPLSRDALYQKLDEHGIIARRYFYPLISKLPMYQEFINAGSDNLYCAESRAQSVLCLPIYPGLTHRVVEQIAELILDS